MQKVFDEVYSLDKRCYEEFGLSEDILMEHAALSMKKVIKDNFDKDKKILIVAGPGNNGADGITLSRILHKSYEVSLYLPVGTKSKMGQIQFQRAKNVGVNIVKKIKNSDIVVDALFGSGLNKSLNDEFANIIKKLNKKDAYKISCDIPSGIDTKGNPSPVAFRADVSVSMGAYKTPLFGDNAKDFVGDIVVADLGISREIYESKSDTILLEESDMTLPVRNKKTSNKGNYGHTVFLCGDKPGASIIASSAAFAFGSGLCSIVSNKNINQPFEIMNTVFMPKNCTSFCFGMGLGKEYDEEMVCEAVEDIRLPLVIDADIFSDRIIKDILQKRGNIVLTPHPKEFASMLSILGIASVDAKEVQKDRFAFVRDFTKKYKDIVLLLKGSNTLIAKNGKIYINTFGTNALSKGGSGDVLSGLIGSLLSQGYDPLNAAISASLAHSIASKRYKKANYSLTPFELIEEIKCL